MGSFIYSKFALACFWVIEREGVWFGTKDSLGIERAACFEDPRVVGLVVKTVALPDEDHFQYCNACGLASGTLCSLHQETMGAQGTAGSGKFCARNVRGMGGQRSGSCFRCGEVGHFARGCPHSRNSRY